jgi:hypothetical protein
MAAQLGKLRNPVPCAEQIRKDKLVENGWDDQKI